MNCTNCGAPLKDGDQFCKSCGTPRAPMAQPAASMPYQDPTAHMPAQGQPAQGRHAYQDQQAGFAGQADPREQRRAEKEAQRAANAELRDARQAYKEARANAGKSAAPKVIAIIVALVLAAAAGAGAMWYFGGATLFGFSSPNAVAAAPSDSSDAASDEAEGSSSSAAGASSEAAGSSAAASSSSASSASAASGDMSVVAKGYIGTWEGDMTETANLSMSSYVCYGARTNPMTLEITELESTGRLSADATVLVHAHDMHELDRDVDSTGGDKVVELKNLTGSFDNGSFEMKGEVADDAAEDDITVSIKVKTDDGSSSERRLIVTVEGNRARDTYALTKAS